MSTRPTPRGDEAGAETAASVHASPRPEQVELPAERNSVHNTPREPPLPVASARQDEPTAVSEPVPDVVSESVPEPIAEPAAEPVTEVIPENASSEQTGSDAPPNDNSIAEASAEVVSVEPALTAASEDVAQTAANPNQDANQPADAAVESSESLESTEPIEPAIPPFTYDPLSHPDLIRAPLEFSLPNYPYAQLHASIGANSGRRNNLHYLTDSVLIYAVGNTVVLFDTVSQEKQTLFGIGRGGIGAICVHPTKEVFAVAEKGHNPNIFIYEYPALKVVRILRKGTERAFCDLEFDKSGELLASVGSAPDYLLTIWRWREEAMVLHTKAFSQEVYRVSFSPNFEGRLTTSGMGHIRFWRMAETFTGLKLQGDIGKFGNVELSDVAAFVELPNGKIICGTETGTLLLWDGDLIQFVIMRNKTTPCHDGMIEFLCIEDGNTLISAGADGYLRFWDLNAILDGDVEGDSAFVLEPRQSVRIGGANTHVRVKGMLRGDAHWIVLDESGALWRLNVPAFTAAPLMRFHAGSVDALVVNRSSHHITAGGADGRLRCWDPHTKSIVFQRAFGSHEKNAPAITAIAPLPAALDPEAVMCAVGGADGVLRVVLRGVDRYSIAEIVKPHKCPITHVCYSPDGGQLATVGTDQTVFFFDCAPRQAYQPIGFIQLPSMPRSVCWSADSGQLLIAVSSEVLLVTRPQMSQVDTSTTFLITLRTRVFSFPAPPKPVAAPVVEEKKSEDDRKSKRKDKADAAPVIPDIPPPEVVAVCPTPDGQFYCAVRGNPKQQPNLFLCSPTQPLPLRTIPLGLPLQERDEAFVTHLSLSMSGKYLLVGYSHGAVQVRPIEDARLFLMLSVHENGAPVTAVTLSTDDALLTSSGRDGSLFIHRVDMAKALALYRRPDSEEQDIVMPPSFPLIPLESEDDIVADIIDPNVYSIEEAKQKQEADNRKSDAEKKKDLVRARLSKIRSEFLILKQRNIEEFDELQRFQPEDFEFDPEYKAQLLARNQEKVQQARAETAWLAEKFSLQLAKLRAKFLGMLLVECIPLSSFRTNLKVTSFRTPELPDFLKSAIDEVHVLLESEATRRAEAEAAAAAAAAAHHDDDDAGMAVDDEDETEQAQATHGSTHGTTTHSATGAIKKPVGRNVTVSAPSKMKFGQEALHVAQAAARRDARLDRKKKMEYLDRHKPDSNTENPADVLAIRNAEENMGDFKLKSDKNYVVPERLRVNYEKKRQQMVLLQESVHFTKMGLNERFLALRDLKRRIIDNIKKDNIRLREINAKLGITESLFEPELDPQEWPENRDVVTKQELVDFAEQKEKARIAAEKAKSASAYGGGDDDDADKKKKDHEKERLAVDQVTDEVKPALTPEELHAAAVAERAAAHTARLAAVPESDLEARERAATMVLLEHERRTLLSKIEKTVQTFDQAIADLRLEKFRLDVDLRSADLRMLTLFQELQMLRNFETTETALTSKLARFKGEKAAVVAEIADCQDKLQGRLAEITAWQERDKQLFSEFQLAVGGEKSEFYAQLLKIYKKKIKRAKKKDDEDEEESDDDFSADDFGDEDESDNDDDESCPVNCENSVYEKVLELRDKRLDQDDLLSDINKAVDELKKLNDRLQTRERTIDKELRATDKDIQSFQSEKQQALNQVVVTVPIKLQQISFLDEQQRLPSDISSALIFTQPARQRLIERIQEVQVEKTSRRKEISDLRARHKQLKKTLVAKQEQIDAEKKVCEEVQMLKLGRVIDPDLLEKMSVNHGATKLQEQLVLVERECDSELADWDRKDLQAKNDLAAVVCENSERLQRVGELTKAQYELEQRLNSSTKNVNVGDTGPMDAKAHDERMQLIELVKTQANDIEALKAEIHILRRKGGHVYAAITPQSRQATMSQSRGLSGSMAQLAATNAQLGATLQQQQQLLQQQMMMAQSQSLGVHGSRTGTARTGTQSRGGLGQDSGLGAVEPPNHGMQFMNDEY